jgi:TRAP-type C4-dicarboxylate transport system substrate-binding protein
MNVFFQKWIVIAVLAGAGALSAPSLSRAEEMTVKLATTLPVSHPTCQALEGLREAVQQIPDPSMRLAIFPEAQLGPVHELVPGLQFGNIELGILTSDVLAALAPELAVVSLPYVFRSDEQRFRVLDGPIGVRLLSLLEEQNLVGLGFLEADVKNLVTKQQAVTTPADLHGLTIAVTCDCEEPDVEQHKAVQLAVKTMTTLGATTKIVPRSEITAALQSEEYDGWETDKLDCTPGTLADTGANYVALTNHAVVPDILVASKIWFDTLSADSQRALQEAAKIFVRHQRMLWQTCLEEMIADLESRGIRLEPVDREAFAEAVQPVYATLDRDLGSAAADLVQTIRAVK